MTISKYISKVVYQEKTKHLIIGTDGVYFFLSLFIYSFHPAGVTPPRVFNICLVVTIA